MNKRRLNLLVSLVLSSGFAQAAIADLDVIAPTAAGFPGLIQDSAQGLVWLQDTNWAWNSGYQTSFMTWHQAMAWADQLVVTYNGQVFDNWRLSTVAEMTYLHDHYSSDGYPIGTGYVNTADPENPVKHTDPGPFLVDRFLDNGIGPSADAWAWDQYSETQAYGMDMDAYFGAWIIDKSITGDNLTWGAVMVPEPETWAMLLAGLGLVGLRLARRQEDRLG